MHHLRVHQISFFPRRTRESSISISLTIAHQTVPSIFNIFTPCIHLHGCTMKKKQRINIKKNKIKLLIHFVCRRTHIRCVLYIVFLSFIFSLSMINWIRLSSLHMSNVLLRICKNSYFTLRCIQTCIKQRDRVRKKGYPLVSMPKKPIHTDAPNELNDDDVCCHEHNILYKKGGKNVYREETKKKRTNKWIALPENSVKKKRF